MLYGYEAWRLTKKSKRALEATEMNIIRRSMNIS
jgi:hypothetical protein